MKAIFLTDRDWGFKVAEIVGKNPILSEYVVCEAYHELNSIKLQEFDVLLTCGCSEILSKEVHDAIEIVGVHCAELDRYSYGSPIQNQIIDGIKFTKHRIFKLSYSKESSRAHAHDCIYSHEVELDLSGNMEDILYQMTSTAIILFNKYLNDFPNIIWKPWPKEGIIRERRNPDDSRISKETLINMNTEELYNFFRCLEDPYPNGYIEDEVGRLYINKVKFKKK